jgi:MerR family transcriptional regulator, copper efflux regulator
MLVSPSPLLKIGELAHRSGVSVKTIRYYEECGLIQTSDRTEGQFRLFHPEMVQRLHFIKRLQGLGLSLNEIGECLAVYDQGDLPCQDIAHKLGAHIEAIDRQMESLKTLRGELTELLSNWSDHPISRSDKICPNLDL